MYTRISKAARGFRQRLQVEAATPARGVALTRDARRLALAREVARLRALVGESTSGNAPVVVGPFTGEVGYEILYWIPFLRWAIREFRSLRGRLIVVSRGGVRRWLSGLDAEYVELFSLYGPSELANRQPSTKQRMRTAFEDEVYGRVREQLGLADVAVLHPSLFYNFYYRAHKIDPHAFARAVTPTADGAEGLAAVYEPIPKPPPAARPAGLPGRYVAIRFYSNPRFPPTRENRAFVGSLVRGLAQTTPIVLLSHRLVPDDHLDLPTGGEVFSLEEQMSAEDNLDVQTLVLAGADAFIGTFGGLCHLSAFAGTPALGFGTSLETAVAGQIEHAQAVAAQDGFGDLLVLRPRDLALAGLAVRALASASGDDPETTASPGLRGRDLARRTRRGHEPGL